MKTVFLAVFLAAGVAMAGGFEWTEENDVFGGTDRYYTQGMELKFLGDSFKMEDGWGRYGVGVRNLIYTPEDITVAEPQPDDRPWAGMTLVSATLWEERGRTVEKIDFGAGVTGPDSESDRIQTWFHDMIGSREPKGWDNQGPSEGVVQGYWRRWDRLERWGEKDGLSADASSVFAASMGTAFIDASAGLEARAGWKVPSSRLCVIAPTAGVGGPYGYVLSGIEGKVKAHDVTLGGSFFHEGMPRVDEMEPFVTDARVGLLVGWRRLFGAWDMEASWVLTRRSEEFEGQDGPAEFGTLRLAMGTKL